MPGEVSHVALFLQIPDLNLRVLSSRAEDEAVGVELRSRERDAGEVAHFGEQRARADVRERPVLVGRGGEHVVAGRVQGEPRHRALVRAQDHCRLRTRIKNNIRKYLNNFFRKGKVLYKCATTTTNKQIAKCMILAKSPDTKVGQFIYAVEKI